MTLSGKQSRKQAATGVVIVNTGQGKGKTTAALGAMLRAWGRGQKVCMIQFLKHERGKWGEIRAADKMDGFEVTATGDGFSWQSEDEAASRKLARQGWELAKQLILSQEYDLIVLDEFTYPLDYGWLDAGEITDWLRQNKPLEQHLIITGRRAPQLLVDYANIVSEVVKIKHHHDQGQGAQAGIEF